MAESVHERMCSLSSLSKSDLSLVWKQVFETRYPAGLGKGILVRILAHRMQEQCYRGLSVQTHRALRELARGLEKGRCVCEIKPGTRLVRQWRGQTHVVTAEEKGFEYKGCAYQSLSKIARVITSTRWSGPLFFGLKGKTENTQEEEARGR